MNDRGIPSLPAYPSPINRKPFPQKMVSWSHACLWAFGCWFLAWWIASLLVRMVREVDLDPGNLSLLFGVVLLVLSAQQRRIDRLERRIHKLDCA